MNQKAKIFLLEEVRHAFIIKTKSIIKEFNSKILANFDNIDEEVDLLRTKLLNGDLYTSNPNRYRDDEAQLYEGACSLAISHETLLYEMRRELLLNITSMLYFNFDKTLRSWLFNEIGHTWNINDFEKWIWKTDIGDIYDLLELFDFNCRCETLFNYLNALGLIVNTYKHGYGRSLSKLKTSYPEYLNTEFIEKGFIMSLNNEYTNLKVSKTQLEAFGQAITDFWISVPRTLICDNVNQITHIIERKNKKKKEV